ncbi:MarR family winged helix-turn-helix transcriptional regulator [Kiloniella sp. b19]|uniref:MarR family winged helix-turn-helix transcriptional regulator n=1 Tax=Kiloniella sp. GXU_MW_B19 TaxID=3141326 RepID=UPI0031D31203
MRHNLEAEIRFLLNRLDRVASSNEWDDDLNPTQVTILQYLARANRLSRSPSVIADYMGTTRGTISQSLKSLAGKGLVSKVSLSTDQRTTSFELTEKGSRAAGEYQGFQAALSAIPQERKEEFLTTLREIAGHVFRENKTKLFGICKDCTYLEIRNQKHYCSLMNWDLLPESTEKICHKHTDRPAVSDEGQ